ncbi:MAG: hypothetical protein M3O35_19535 [Acidobacteriota bacterium]|nr:hypothetical protein [Acidobacteriota bacterium]
MTPLRIAQMLAVARLEMRKTFFARRGLWIYLLAFAPVVLFAGHSIAVMRFGQNWDFGEDTTIFATTFQFFYIRLAVFFGCVGIFMNLFRGEVLDKSLHFYFLAALRREVVLAGKFLAGMLAAVTVFGLSTALQLAALFAHMDSNTLNTYFFHNGGMAHVAAYLGVTVLACIGYGSIFMAGGILFRNPIIPAAGILIWEAINSFLPALLQKFSIIYYLKSLCPISAAPELPSPFSLMAVNVDPMPAIIAIPGVLALSALVIIAASFQVRRMEINYGSD